MIDIDVGLARTGVATPAGPSPWRIASKDIQRFVLRASRVTAVIGSTSLEQKPPASVNAGMKRLGRRSARERRGVTSRSLPAAVREHCADAALGILNEAQPGSYVFMDAHYRDALGVDEDAFEQSLFVQAQVVRANAEPWVTVDAGLKAFATDGPLPRPTGPRFGGSSYFYFGDEHGGLSRPAKGPPVELGERVEFIPPHCDPTVDRHDVIFLVRNDVLIDTISIEAARRSQGCAARGRHEAAGNCSAGLIRYDPWPHHRRSAGWRPAPASVTRWCEGAIACFPRYAT
jgi:D-serine deaminase-like pyridoxal phosphate-dependent protein